LTWRIIAHLSLNFFSLADCRPDGKMHDATVIRELLRVYAEMDPRNEDLRRWIDGIQRVGCCPTTRRIHAEEAAAFRARVELTLEVDPRAFDGSGLSFFLAQSLNCFLSRRLR